MTGALPFHAVPVRAGIDLIGQDSALLAQRLADAGIAANSLSTFGPLAMAVAPVRFVDLAGMTADAVDRLFDDLGPPDARWIVSAPLDLLDHAAARIADHGGVLLCDPGDVDRIAAIHVALNRIAPASLREGGEDVEAQLRQLNEEVARIARVLSELASTGSGALADRRRDYDAPPSDAGDTPVPAVAASDLRAAIRARRLRDRYFPADLFGDPAWDILLDLMLAEIEHRRVPVSSLCIAAAVPPTTALRWIGQMTEQKLLTREADALDRRRSYIKLTADAGIRMRRLLGALAAQGLPIP
ncbi:hypothetical protein ACPVPU_14285 [Sphingomonas sp. CJ99]